MKHSNRQKMNMLRLGRRLTALALVLAMSLPTVAFAVDEGSVTETPTPAEYVVPTITIEANAVVDRWYDPKSTAMKVEDYLTGDLEVAIRVQTGALTDGQKAKGLGFNSLGVALKYSPILTPYKWTLIDGIDLSGEDLSDMTAEERAKYKKDAATPVDLTTTITPFEKRVNMQTLKSKQVTEAVGQVSGAEGEGGYLYMEVRSDRPIELKEDTVLAVVTFRYDLTQYQIKATDAANWLTPAVVTPPAGGGGTGGEETGGGTEAGGGTARAAGNYDCLLQFATQTDLNGDLMAYELMYNPANSRMYYTAGTALADEVGKALELEDPTTSNYQGAPTGGKVNFRLVNHTTYNDGGLSLDDLATVLFYDWDDTLIGLVIVPKDGDARKTVNDYIGSHFIHPQLAGNTNYTSLKRIDSYRGKYPATEPMADGAVDDPNTIVTDGETYALTNKLDYVFFKRPMEQVMTTNPEGEKVPTGEWKQRTVEGKDGAEEGDWDNDYPYLHGWAEVPDYRHPEKVWTTLGMGELASYSGASTGVNSGGYKEVGTEPVTVTPTDANFDFADFDFRLKNGHSRSAGSIYAVKAIYEPGANLLGRGYRYRMISEPYYNKLNDAEASAGGAYSIDAIFERASTSVNNVVRGVARMREPYVRQDTTTDLRWEKIEGENLLVDHNLPNATMAQTYTDKNKTTYTKVDISNAEEIPISLTLSARQNKVDYYLIDAFGYNFVAGGARSENDSSRSELQATIDNYHYFVDESDEFDVWYDAGYNEREGSRGFVLTGTLNQMMELATQCADKKIARDDLYSYMKGATFADVNLCLAGGTAPVAFNDIEEMIDHLLAAVEKARPKNNGGSTKYWDTVHDCALLTYHQIQGFVLDGSLDHDESPILDSNGKAILTWCHLHKACVDAVSTKPKNWRDLIDKARTSPDDIDGLTLNEVETLFHLRKDSSGTPFDSVAEFKAAIIAAVGASGYPSWDQVQANILNETLPALEERNYWWYNGATSVPLDSLMDTVAAAQDGVKAVKLPDDTTMVRYDKLNQLKGAFKENEDSPTVAESWNTATKNLCITKAGSEGEKFNTFADFRSAFIAAVGEAEKNNITLDVTATSAEVYSYWQKLQYHILTGTYSPTHLDVMDTYWWYDGMSKIGDLPSLLAAAQRQVELDKAGAGGEDAVFKMFGVSDLYDATLTELHFRSNFHGDKYTDIDAFKNGVKAFVQLRDKGINVTIANSGSNDFQKTTSWRQLQYYLIHKDDAGFDPATISDETKKEQDYYWWRNGADGEAIALTINTTDSAVQTLMEAVYRHVVNGNPWACNQLDAAAAAGFRLVSDYDKTDATVTNWDTLLAKWGYTDANINSLHTALDNLYGVIPAGTDYKTITWRQIQHYLLETEYKPADGTDYPSDKREDVDGYWWKEGNDKPVSGGETKTDLEYLFAEMDKYIKGDATADLDAAVDQYIFSGKLGFRGGPKRKPIAIETVTNNTQKTNVRKVIVALSDTIKSMMKSDPTITSSANVLDWYILQYYVINDNASKYKAGNAIVDHATALAYYLTDLKGNWVPTEYEASGAAMVAMMAMFAMRPNSGADTVIDVDPDTGVTTVTTTTETELDNGWILVVETVTTVDPETNMAETRVVTTLYDQEGNELSSTETVTQQPQESPQPTESPLPEETESPAPAGPDDPIGPEESPAPAETEDPEESPVPTETVEPDDPIGPTESPDPTPSTSPEELPDPDVPKTETPDPTGSSEPFDSTETNSSADPAGSDDTSDLVGPDDPIGPDNSDTADTLGRDEVELSFTPSPDLSATALTRERFTHRPLLFGKGTDRLRRTPLPHRLSPPGRLLTGTLDRHNTLTIGRTRA